MNQPSLLDPKVVKPEFTIPDDTPAPARETGLSISEPQPPALMEFRRAFMSMEPGRMNDALGQYWDRRKALRDWLLAHMVEGIHYGFSPGCIPTWCDINGKTCPKDVAWGTLGYKNAKVSLESWTPKPALYAAGGDLVCDLMWVRDEYEADMLTWQMLGSQPGHIVRKCKLFNRIDGAFLCEGTGARLLGQKGGDVNNSVKMADKCAKVAAVMNGWGLRELFTQDEAPDGQPPKRPSPEADPSAPIGTPRADRVTKEEVNGLNTRWKKAADPSRVALPDWSSYVHRVTAREFDDLKLSEWSREDLEKIITDLCERGV